MGLGLIYYVNCVVLGNTLADVRTSVSSPACQPVSPSCSEGVTGQSRSYTLGQKACGILVPDNGLNLHILQWELGVLNTRLPGKPNKATLTVPPVDRELDSDWALSWPLCTHHLTQGNTSRGSYCYLLITVFPPPITSVLSVWP